MLDLDLAGLAGYVLVGALGAFVGTGELVSRYRDEPVKALLTTSAFVYVAVNVVASLAALATIHTFGWFAANPRTDQADLTQVLVAGFGAMALFRSSLFMVRVGNDDVGIGPVAFLQVILEASDRGVDRKRGEDRAPKVAEIMKGLEFDALVESLPLYAMALLQHVDADDATNLGNQVAVIRSSAMSPRLKTLNLGLVTMNVVGEDLLRAAADAFRVDAPEVKAAGQAPKPEDQKPKPADPDPKPADPDPKPADPDPKPADQKP